MDKKKNKKRRSAAKIFCKKDESRSQLTGDLPLIIPILISAAVLLWYAMFKLGLLGMYSSTAYSVFISVIVVFGLIFGILRIPTPAIGWLPPIFMVIAFRFPPIDCALYFSGWLIAWHGISKPEWGQTLFSGATYLCYLGLIANLLRGDDWPFGNINYLALASGIIWSIYLGKWIVKTGTSNIYHLIGMTIVLAILVFIKNRGQSALVLMMLGSLTLIYIIKKPWQIIIACGGALIIGGAAWSGVLKEALYSSGKIGSVYDRLLHFGITWNGFLTAPVFGKGVWGYSLAQYADPLFRITSWPRMDADPANAHNIFLQLLVCSGAVGVLTLIIITAWMLWLAIRSQKEKTIPFIFAMLAFFIAGAVSKAPFSTPGIVIWGAVWGALAASIVNTVKKKDHHVASLVWHDRLIKEYPKGAAAKILRWVLALGILLFSVVQPLNHEHVLRKPYLASEQPFWWLFYAPRVFFPSTAHISKVLFESKRYEQLYEFEKAVNTRVPRKIGQMRVAYAASLAGRPKIEICQAAVKQFLWHPFQIQPKEHDVLREIMLKGGVKTLERHLTKLNPSEARAVACFAGISVPKPESVRRLLTTNHKLSIMEMAWALHGAFYLKKTDPPLFQKVVKRCLQELEREGGVTYFLARYFDKYL